MSEFFKSLDRALACTCGVCGICGGRLNEPGTSSCYEAHGSHACPTHSDEWSEE